MAAQFWGKTAAVKEQHGAKGGVLITEEDMPAVEWGLVQIGAFPDYAQWIPYSDYNTFTNLSRLTSLETLVFTTSSASLEDLIQYTELCSSLYYHLMDTPNIKCRYTRDATWSFGKVTMNCILGPLTKSIHAMVCEALVYSTQMESGYFIDTLSRKDIHNAMTRVLGFCRFIISTLDELVTDLPLLTFLEDDVQSIKRLIPYLRAYMFFNLGSIKDVLKQDKSRKALSTLRPEPTPQTFLALTRAITYYLAALRTLHKLPLETELEHGKVDVFRHPHVSMSRMVKDVDNVIVGQEELETKRGERRTRVTTSPTSWPQYLTRDILASHAILFWVTTESGKAIGLARLSLTLGEPIDLSDGWEQYHMRIGTTSITTDPDSLIDLLTKDVDDVHETWCVEGLDIFGFLQSDAPLYAFIA